MPRSHMPHGQSIIIADTDSELRNVMRVELVIRGFIPYVTSTPEEAVQLAMATIAHTVILEARQPPDLMAYDACLRIRQLPDYQAVPILLLYRGDDPRVYKAATEARASSVLMKPFSVYDLLVQLEPYVVDTMDPRAVANWRRPGGQYDAMTMAAEPMVQVWEPPPKPVWSPAGNGNPVTGMDSLSILRRAAKA